MADKSDEFAPPLEDLVRKVEQGVADPSVLQEPLQDESNWEHAEELGEIAKLTYLHLVAGDDEELCRRLRQKLKTIEEELGIARIPKGVEVYLDNGAFFFGSMPGDAPLAEYEEFVEKAKPDWKPIPQDYIPFPSMTPQKQRGCFDKTMRINVNYQHNGYVPVVHIGKHLMDYTAGVSADASLSQKPWIALGAIVPNLLRKPKAMPYADVLLPDMSDEQFARDAGMVEADLQTLKEVLEGSQ